MNVHNDVAYFSYFLFKIFRARAWNKKPQAVYRLGLIAL